MEQPIVALKGEDPRLPVRENQSLRFDSAGLPKGLPVNSWWSVIERIAATKTIWGDWPESHREFVRMTLRFTRPDGSSAFEPAGSRPERLSFIRSLNDPGLTTICRWWSSTSGRSDKSGPPPLPAFGSESQAIALLRADWAKHGDFLAVDARDPAKPSIDLTIGGLPLLGPIWSGPAAKTRMRIWKSSSMADVAEWSIGAGECQAIRTAVFLRGRKIALLAEEKSHKQPGIRTLELGTAEGVVTKAVLECRSLIVKSGSRGLAARAVPIPITDSTGSFAWREDTLSIQTEGPAGRHWMPLLISWDAERNRRPLKWRTLTVSENAKACKPGVAFAARVSWGLGDSLVIYRSLGRPAPRTFLGHQTSSRFLIGTFSQEGNVSPLLTLD